MSDKISPRDHMTCGGILRCSTYEGCVSTKNDAVKNTAMSLSKLGECLLIVAVIKEIIDIHIGLQQAVVTQPLF